MAEPPAASRSKPKSDAKSDAGTAPPALPLDAPLPWLEEIWSRLRAARAADRLAHGLLIAGPAGVGKRHLAELLARALLCRAPRANGVACGRCADCQLTAAGSHPDLLRVGPDPESKSGEIPIDAVRAFSERESLTPSRADWKVALIDPADRLNAAAANALLKTLEEPSGRTILCLIAERPERLPATVRSRCQQVRVQLPEEGAALAWLGDRVPAREAAARLGLAHGAPLLARSGIDGALLARERERLTGFLELARGRRDPLAEAALWNELGMRPILDWLATWLSDLLRLAVSAAPPRLERPERRAELAELAARLKPEAAHRFLRQVLDARALTETTVNPLLLLESLAIDWSRIERGPTHERF